MAKFDVAELYWAMLIKHFKNVRYIQKKSYTNFAQSLKGVFYRLKKFFKFKKIYSYNC